MTTLYPDKTHLGGTDDEARAGLVECLPPNLQVKLGFISMGFPFSHMLPTRDRVGPLLKEAGRTEALEWLFRETQPMG